MPDAPNESAPGVEPTPPTAEPAALTFADLGLDDATLRAVREAGYETPSAIQAQTIPALLAGRDVVGLAQTGTGKTAAFALPILSRLDRGQKNPQALVLAPTRELALQVCESFEKYGAHKGIHVLPIYGGQGYGTQLSALRRGVHVVVGTPGRIMDLLEKRTLDLSELKYLVLDEADEMLKMGFAEDVETILAQTPKDKQVAMFSATMPAPIRRLSAKYLRDPQEITVRQKTSTVAALTQRYLVVSYPQKVDALTRILEVENFEAMRPSRSRRSSSRSGGWPRGSVRPRSLKGLQRQLDESVVPEARLVEQAEALRSHREHAKGDAGLELAGVLKHRAER